MNLDADVGDVDPSGMERARCHDMSDLERLDREGDVGRDSNARNGAVGTGHPGRDVDREHTSTARVDRCDRLGHGARRRVTEPRPEDRVDDEIRSSDRSVEGRL